MTRVSLEEFAQARARTEAQLPAFIGLDEDRARALAAELNLRIDVLAGKGQAATLDLRSDRVRVTMSRQGLVVSARAG